jgi:hypothetical protein
VIRGVLPLGIMLTMLGAFIPRGILLICSMDIGYIHEDQVGSGLSITVSSVDGILQVVDRQGIGPGHDDQVRI